MEKAVMATSLIDWRKLIQPLAFILVLPCLLAILIDLWLGSLPLLTIIAIVICFPTAGFFLNRITMQEMDRVINEIAPVLLPEEEDGVERSSSSLL
jgi:4-hydroxybenzoate polyprenyltransferase